MKRTRDGGSAMLLAIIIVIIVAGIGGAFLVTATVHGKRQFDSIRGDEAQVICEAAIEHTRRALLEYRNADPFNDTDPTNYAWNEVLTYCSSTGQSTGILNTTDIGTLSTAYKTALQDKSSAIYGAYNPDDTNSGDAPYTDIPSSYTDLFCTLRPYDGAAYHVLIRNNNDIFGDGVDDDDDGDPWNADTLTEQNAGNHSDVIDGDRRVFLIATALLPDGTVRQVEALLEFPQRMFVPSAALLTDGTIKMSGAFEIMGTRGVVHANEDIIGNGGANAQVQVAVNASSSAANFTMANTPPGGINSGATEVSIPTVDLSYFKGSDFEYSDYVVVLGADGSITRGSAVTGDTSGFVQGNDGSWSISGRNSVAEAIYYVEGDFSMTGQGNSAPYYMTIVAEGSVKLAGNSMFFAFRDQTTQESTNTLVIADQDVALRGTGSSATTPSGGNAQYQGLIFANEQVEIMGNYTLEGSIIGANATDTTGSLVTSSSRVAEDATVGGNPSIIYDGFSTFLPPLAESVSIVAVRRLQ